MSLLDGCGGEKLIDLGSLEVRLLVELLLQPLSGLSGGITTVLVPTAGQQQRTA
jgi:hypothetical protein